MFDHIANTWHTQGLNQDLTPKPPCRTASLSLNDPLMSWHLLPKSGRANQVNTSSYWPQREAAPWEVRGQGSYLAPDSILTNTLGAGLRGDTATFQHDLVWGTEAAFWGMVSTGARVALTVQGAALFTMVVHEGWWAWHSCRWRRWSLWMAHTNQKHS